MTSYLNMLPILHFYASSCDFMVSFTAEQAVRGITPPLNIFLPDALGRLSIQGIFFSLLTKQ